MQEGEGTDEMNCETGVGSSNTIGNPVGEELSLRFWKGEEGR